MPERNHGEKHEGTRLLLLSLELNMQLDMDDHIYCVMFYYCSCDNHK